MATELSKRIFRWFLVIIPGIVIGLSIGAYCSRKYVYDPLMAELKFEHSNYKWLLEQDQAKCTARLKNYEDDVFSTKREQRDVEIALAECRGSMAFANEYIAAMVRHFYAICPAAIEKDIRKNQSGEPAE